MKTLLSRYPVVGPDEDVIQHPFGWLNGEIFPITELALALFTHFAHYATAVISGIGAWKRRDGPGHVGFRWEEHVKRFRNNFLAVTGHECPLSQEVLLRALREIARINLPHLSGTDDLYLRLFGGQGSELLGVGSQGKLITAIGSRNLTEYLKLGSRPGATLLYPGNLFRRQHPSQGFPFAKAISNYNRGALFKAIVAELLKLQYEEVLAQTWDGQELSETTGSNIFIIIDGVAYSPWLQSWCLDGITRNTLIYIFNALGIKVVADQPVTEEMLFRANGVFLTGTWSGVVPVAEVLFDPNRPEPPPEIYTQNGGANFLPWVAENFRPVPISAPFVGKTGPITKQVQEIYWSLVRDPTQKHPVIKMDIPPSWHTVI